MSLITGEEITTIQSIFNDDYSDPYQRLLQVQAYLKASKQKHLDKIVWVTINPKPDIPLSHFIAKVDAFVKRNIVIQPVYSYEQRGETLKNIGFGFHVHILFDKDPKVCPKQYSNYIYNSFKTVVGNTKAVNIHYFPKSFRQDKIDYLMGKKWDVDKQSKRDIDIVWRKAHNLKSLY